MRRFLGANPGDLFRLKVKNPNNGKHFLLRCRITHALKIGPGLDLFSKIAFMSEEQANYIYRILGREGDIHYEKLFITG